MYTVKQRTGFSVVGNWFIKDWYTMFSLKHHPKPLGSENDGLPKSDDFLLKTNLISSGNNFFNAETVVVAYWDWKYMPL